MGSLDREENFHGREEDARIPAVVRRLALRTIVSRGNVIAGLQFSGFIRPNCETECNGFSFPAGYLREHDMAQFRKYYPAAARLADRYADSKDSLILYAWRRARQGSGGGAIVYGATITDAGHNVLARVAASPRYFANLEIVRYLERAAKLRA